MIGWAKRRLGLGHATHNERRRPQPGSVDAYFFFVFAQPGWRTPWFCDRSIGAGKCAEHANQSISQHILVTCKWATIQQPMYPLSLANKDLVCWYEPSQTELERQSPKVNYRKKSNFSPSTIAKVWFSSLEYKTGYPTFPNYQNHLFYLPRRFYKQFYIFFHRFSCFYLVSLN